MKQKEKEGSASALDGGCTQQRAHPSSGSSSAPPGLKPAEGTHCTWLEAASWNLAASAPKMWELVWKKTPLCVHLASEPWIGSSLPPLLVSLTLILK